MKSEILKLLKEADGFLSGQEICNALNVSRTAVWKVIRQMEAEGYQIKAVRNKGYCLLKSADVITKAELESSITADWCGKFVVYYDEADSTNLRARELAEHGACHGTLVVADFQTAGRGRLGREWASEPGVGIWMSLILRPRIQPYTAPMLTLIAALAVRTAIEHAAQLQTLIKWPNDLVVDGKKICGILTEMSAELDAVHYVVVGMGINVNQEVFPEELMEKAASIGLCTGVKQSRSHVIAAVMTAFEAYYAQFLKTGDLSAVIEEYNSYLAGKDETVRVILPGHPYEAKAMGIDETGNLLVQCADGTINRVMSGEVSIRGLHGYI